MNISKNLLHSASAATFSQVWRMVVVFATHMVLRRLIEPGPWGIWHWSEPLFLLLGQVRDLGLPGHMVRMEKPPWGNFLRFELLWGLVCAVTIFFAAPWITWIFKESGPEVEAVVSALALFLFFEGLAKVPLTFFEAELLIGRSVVPEMLRNATYAVVSIGLALGGHGVWSFVVAHIAGALVFAATLWLAAWKHEIPLRLETGIDLELVRKGLPLALMSVLVLLTGRIDPIVLGLRFSPEEVGQYGLALFLAFLVAIAVALPVSRALYPALKKLEHDPAGSFEAYRLATVLVLLIETLFALFLFTNAETVLVLFGGEPYREAAPLLRILCFAPLCQPFARCAGDVLLIRHQDRLLIHASLLSLGSLVGLGYFLTGILGPEGMAIVNLLPLGTLLTTWAIFRVDPSGFRHLCVDLLWVYLAPLPFFLAVLSGDLTPAARFGASLAACAAATALYAWRFNRPFLTFFRSTRT